jgi:peroxiredoxin Q/BCP
MTKATATQAREAQVAVGQRAPELALPSDADTRIAQAYGVWKERSLYGRTFMGIERTTFLIDEQGRISRIFPKVRVDGHLDEVLQVL